MARNLSVSISLPIKLTAKQREVDASPKRFKVLNWGRRVGKTRYVAFWLARNALTMPGKHWYVTRTLSLGRDELFPALLALIPREYIVRVDMAKLTIRLSNGSTIVCKSVEKEDNLRGRGLRSLVIDEAAFIKERVWLQILRPQLGDFMGPALIASSPKKGWFTKLYKEAAGGKLPDYFASHATIYDSVLDPTEIEAIRATTPNYTWRQEYMAEELSDSGQVYEEFGPLNVYDPSAKFADVRSWQQIVGIDYGLDANTGVCWMGISPEGYLVFHSTYVQRNSDIAKHCENIKARSAALKVAANVIDRSTDKRDPTSMISVRKMFADNGVPCQNSEKDVAASVDIVKRFLRGDGQTPWLYISGNCDAAIFAFQDWEHEKHEPDIAAAIRYAATWAVKRHMTPLADMIPTLKIHDESKMFDDAQMLALKAKIRKPVGKAASWRFDYSYGVPV